MSEDKIKQEEILYNQLYERTKNFGRNEFIKELMRLERENKQIKEQLQQRDSVIEEAIDVIDKMLTVGYIDEEHLTSYFAVNKDSEFGCRAIILKNILNKYKKGDKESE